MDVKAIERAAKEAMRNARITTGAEDIHRDIAKAIAAAVAEYDRQRVK